MSCGLDLPRVMQVTTLRARELTGAAAAVLELREGEHMVYRAVSGTAEGALGTRLSLHASLSGRCVLERRILTCDDSEIDPRVDQVAAKRVGARSMLCVPLLHAGEAVGVLKVYSPEVGAFTSEDVGTLELMTGFISAATSNAVAQRALSLSEERFRALAELASDGIITADRDGRITFLNRSAAQMFGHAEGALLGRSFLGLMPERFTRDSVGELADFDPNRASNMVGKTIELVGKRCDASEFPVELSVSSWTVGDERFFTAIVRDISYRKELEQSVLKLARTDHLTCLLSRRAGEEAIARELDRAVRYSRALSFVLLDVDHFKRINDSAGHAGGDSVLRRIGEIVTERVRVTDVAIRWGGEEFLIVLPETDLVGAQDLGDALRGLVEAAAFEVVAQVTLSVGVAQRTPGELAEQTIARADARLYAAKSGGRNRVEI